MKKNASLGMIILFVFAFTLTGCGYTYQETQTDAIVVDCGKGEFHLDPNYLGIAYMYLGQQNYGMFSVYLNIANDNGAYDYNVTIDYNGTNYTVVREKEYKAGDRILVTIEYTYKKGELVKVECK